MDRNGRFIPGLKKKDFKIFENGVQQPITYFQSEEMPFTVILMIDTSPSTKYHIDQIHFAALTFVNQLRPQDQVMVVAFDQRTRVLCEPTTDRAVLYAAIYKANFGSGTGLYDAVSAITNLDFVNSPGRKAVVLFTDGVDTTSRRASYESTVAGVEEVDALFYTIRYDTLNRGDSNPLAAAVRSGQMSQQVYDSIPRDVLAKLSSGGRGGRQVAEYELGRTYLETLANTTGGRMFEADTLTNLEASFSGVAEELRRRYSIGYYGSSDNVPGERKQIKIQVARPKAVVRAKNNYVVKKPDPKPETPTSGNMEL
jgi:VWFA-related protein